MGISEERKEVLFYSLIPYVSQDLICSPINVLVHLDCEQLRWRPLQAKGGSRPRIKPHKALMYGEHYLKLAQLFGLLSWPSSPATICQRPGHLCGDLTVASKCKDRHLFVHKMSRPARGGLCERRPAQKPCRWHREC